MDSQESFKEILEKYCQLHDDYDNNEENISWYEYIPKNSNKGIGWLFELYEDDVIFRIPYSNSLLGYRFSHCFTSTEKLQSFFESLT